MSLQKALCIMLSCQGPCKQLKMRMKGGRKRER